MRVLVVTSRHPARGGKGDQSRSFSYVTRLAERHVVTVVTPGDPSAGPELPASVEVVRVPAPAPARAAAAAAGLRSGVPLQVGAMMPPSTWRRVERAAADCDVAIANTVRSLRGPLPVPVVLDHVDALSLNMERRSSLEGGARAWLLRREARSMRAWERRTAGWASAQVVTSESDARVLPREPHISVIPVGWELPAAAVAPERDIDVVFSGNMRYGPNRDAALWLARDIAPAVRRRRPDARFVVVGRDAGKLRLDGLEVAADVPDPGAYLGRAKIAIAPLRAGTGSPYKVIEAAAAGTAVVGTCEALAPFGLVPGSGSLAEQVVELLSEPAALDRAVAAAGFAATRHSAEEMSREIEAVLEATRNLAL